VLPYRAYQRTPTPPTSKARRAGTEQDSHSTTQDLGGSRPWTPTDRVGDPDRQGKELSLYLSFSTLSSSVKEAPFGL
jgi:hypothetical protein